ncbi:MAG: hypothetical protein QW350_00340 [Candidatus Aenigmatarchaeota archaeon]
MSTKAQIISSDFIVATSIFLLFIAIIYSLWLTKTYYIEEEKRVIDIDDAAITASNIWLREGNPKYWNQSNIIDLGLENNNRLNQTKIDMLNDLGYENVKKLAGLERYDFFMRIYNQNNQTLFRYGKIENAKNIAKIKRVSILNGSIVFLDTIVWSK